MSAGPDRTPEEHEPTYSEERAGEDMDTSIREANERLAGSLQPVLRPAPIDPILALMRIG